MKFEHDGIVQSIFTENETQHRTIMIIDDIRLKLALTLDSDFTRSQPSLMRCKQRTLQRRKK
ncbi:hypothetical protein MJO28_011838 [Puccinia striiformis f. sp. tritici]|uniref:Uncharacterized protein n=1 Tax=Puccinia striiformis f. sp. tritici TaxID=168172 RepID=A0ACC0E396_9BASI|nr:hypothetical protein MJO28_011838 [Puccinia striiformis f. sp. tritici]